MKKIFKTLFATLLLVTTIFAFSGCGCTTQEEIDVTTALATQKDYLITNVYNKPAGTDFNTAEGDNYVVDENYYVTIKTGVHDILTDVTIGGVVFTDDATVSLSVGNNNYLIRNAWKLDEGAFKIASGLLLSSTNSDGKVAVKYGGKDITLITLDEPSNVDFDITVSGNNATISGPVGGKYTYTSSNYAGFMKIVLTNDDENLLDENSIITVEKIKKDANGDVIGITYALTKADVVNGEYCIVFYPAYNAGESYIAGSPANFTMEFKFLVIGVGANSFTFNFVNSAT